MTLKQKTNFMIALLIISILIMPCINAFGASIDYNAQEKPLYLGPGESKDFSFSVTASPGKPTTTKVELKKGSEVARFLAGDQTYNIPAGGAIRVAMNVRVPEGTPEGTEYLVSFLLTDLTASEKGTVGMGGSAEISYKVIVKTPEAPVVTPEKPSNNIWLILIIIILLAIIVVIYFYSKQKKGSVKRK